ncbi:MAG TPA: hypothetical protein DCS93_12150 [Microscillaceae bacterium]|nr:hypothetical protein [Microscillaceae bacterium]
MQTKLEKQANHLWKNYGDTNQRFWYKYERLLKVSRSQVTKRPAKEPFVANASGYTFYEVEEAKTLGEQIMFGCVSLFVALVLSLLITSFISIFTVNIVGLLLSQVWTIYWIVAAILWSYLLYTHLFKRSTEVIGRKTLKFADDHITIQWRQEVKKIAYKYIQQVQYRTHSLKIVAKFPNHGDYVYFIPLFDSKGQKLPQFQAKQVYDQLKMGMQNNC